MRALSIGSLVLAFLMISLAGCKNPQSRERLIPESWSPSLASAQDFVESVMTDQSAVSQRVLNEQSQHLADILDAQLFIVYTQLMQAQDQQTRNRLYEEQSRWLNERDILSKKAIISKGGSLAILEYNAAFIKITRDRLAVLKARLHQN